MKTVINKHKYLIILFNFTLLLIDIDLPSSSNDEKGFRAKKKSGHALLILCFFTDVLCRDCLTDDKI